MISKSQEKYSIDDKLLQQRPLAMAQAFASHEPLSRKWAIKYRSQDAEVPDSKILREGNHTTGEEL